MGVNGYALVTGASSGFGVDFAREFAKRGYDLILVARREDRLRATADEVKAAYGVNVEVVTADLADDEERIRLAKYVEALGKPLDVLVNNAGLGLFGPFESIPWEKEKAMLDVDIDAVVHLCKLFVPGMRTRGRGYVLNVSSIGAYQPTPLYASYSAAKAFVLSFSQALKFELRGTGVSVTVVSPGVAKTEFLQVSKQAATGYQKAMMMSSEDVVKAAVKAMFAKRYTIVPGLNNFIGAMSGKYTPGSIGAAIAYNLMKSNDPQH